MTDSTLVDPPGSDRPVPRAELLQRVTASVDAGAFLAQGRQSALDLEAALATIGRTLDSFSGVLDFGCGSGRILLWLEGAAQRSRLHGTDIDAEAIRWATENIPWASFARNGVEPPLEYPDAHFDLVVSHSVFTHVDEAYQDRWLAELRRVTRPGGVLVLSVHGEHAFQGCVDDRRKMGHDPSDIVEELSSRGILFVADDDQIGGPFPDHYHVSFHAPWYVFAHWGRLFEVRAYLPRRGLDFQDYVVLERPPGDELRPQVVAPRPASRAAAPAPVPATAGADPVAAIRRLAEVLDRPVGGGVENGRHSPVERAAGRVAHRLLSGELGRREAVDRAVLEVLRELTAPRAPTRSEHLMRVAIERQGERIDRLENDLWAAVRALEAGGPQPSTETTEG